MQDQRNEYLGDGAYVSKDDNPSLVLLTSNGIDWTNRVHVDIDNIAQLVTYIKLHFPTQFAKGAK